MCQEHDTSALRQGKEKVLLSVKEILQKVVSLCEAVLEMLKVKIKIKTIAVIACFSFEFGQNNQGQGDTKGTNGQKIQCVFYLCFARDATVSFI